MCITNCHDMTVAVKMALNPNTANTTKVNVTEMTELAISGAVNSLPNNKIVDLSKL